MCVVDSLRDGQKNTHNAVVLIIINKNNNNTMCGRCDFYFCHNSTFFHRPAVIGL